MKAETARQELERFLVGRGITLASLTPAAGIEAMVSFYGAVRVTDCNLDSDGDMLLFQWGMYDWGAGLRFEVDITRQFIVCCGDEDSIWQLQLTFAFPPTDLLRAVGKGDRWCSAPSELDDFISFIQSHPALAAVGSRPDAKVTLHCDCAG
jgi:hypothetical protein